MKLHTTPCPTCAAPAQKTHGCNHMICFKCNTHFCYLCSAWLSPDNPYKHYNADNTGCYMRLWELEGGDGDDIGIGYAGVVQEAVAAIEAEEGAGNVGPQPAQPDDMIQVENVPAQPIVAALPDAHVVEEPNQPEPPPELEPRHQAFQREGPLVLRINQAPPPPAVPQAPAPVQPVRRNGRLHHAAAPPQVGVRGGRRRNGNGRVPPIPQVDAQAREAINQAWVQMFVQAALNDEEDQLEWDSEDENGDPAWEIPVR